MRYNINPALIPQKQTGPLGTLGNLAMQKGISAGINAAVPGGGFAAEAAQAVAPQLVPRFQGGGQVQESNWDKMMRQWAELQGAVKDSGVSESMGKIKKGLGTKAGQQQVQRAMLPMAAQAYRNMGGPLGGGQTKEGLMEARRLGALTQEEFLKAMKHGNYLNAGGKPTWYMDKELDAELREGRISKEKHDALYRKEGGGIHIKPENKGKFTAKAKAAGMGVQEYARKVLASDSASPATKKQANFARNAAAWHKEDGGRIGPLSKTVHKTKDGESYEMNYHNPLAGGSSSGDK